jgi:hypothetical protein
MSTAQNSKVICCRKATHDKWWSLKVRSCILLLKNWKCVDGQECTQAMGMVSTPSFQSLTSEQLRLPSRARDKDSADKDNSSGDR